MSGAASRESSRRIEDAVAELLRVFKTSGSKHEANARAKPVLDQLSRDPSFLTAIIERYVTTPGALDKQNYPVVGMELALNPHFGLVANCWIPLPGRETHISTKAIHHHGNMLLSTVTLWGPGYEHWMFSPPRAVDEGAGLYSMDLLEVAPHVKHHVSFVDAHIAHTPMYPSELSITLALWSNQFPVTWRDRVKRLPGVKGRETQLRNAAQRLGLTKALDLKIVSSFDYYPVEDGFRVMRERKEFGLGPNVDHVCSVFHIMQATGNEHLARRVRNAIDEGKVTSAKPHVERLLASLEQGRPIEGKLSECHFGFDYANFTRDDMRRALEALKGRAGGPKTRAAHDASP